MIGFDNTITIYTSIFDPTTNADKYTATVVNGSSWQTKHINLQNGTTLSRANVHKIRIPIDSIESDFVISEGDRIVKGVGGDIERLEELEGRFKDICTVKAVHDNNRIGLRHIYVEGG